MVVVEPRDSFSLALSESKFYNRLSEISSKNHAVTQLLSLVEESCLDAYQRTKSIIKYMKEYTLHDGDHLFNVLRLMEILVPEELFLKLTPLELALFILSAFYHDIGMAPDENDVLIWVGAIDEKELKPEQLKLKKDYVRFCAAKPSLHQKINYLKSIGKDAQSQVLEGYRLSEWIRTTHATRAAQVVRAMTDKLVYKDTNFAEVLAIICQSHNENNIYILQKQEVLNTCLLVGSDEFVNCAYIAIILRLADVLDFDAKRAPKVLFEHLGVRDPISLQEWKKHRAIEAWVINKHKILFSASCTHPAIEKSIRDFCTYIEQELNTCNKVLEKLTYLSGMEERKRLYHVNAANNVDTSQIRPAYRDGKPLYDYEDITFSLNQYKIIELLMGTNLYGNSMYALRELIQNAVDTCRLRIVKQRHWQVPYSPLITVKFYKENGVDVLEIEDNGMGMDKDILIKYFSQVGTSYYRSFEFLEDMAELSEEFSPISKFGIGFLSSFMIADSVEIKTNRLYKAYKSADNGMLISIQEATGFFHIKNIELDQPGTHVKMILKENHPLGNTNDIEESSTLLNSIRGIVRHLDIPILIETDNFRVELQPTDFDVEFGVGQIENILTFDFYLNGEFDGLNGLVKCIFLSDGENIVNYVEQPVQQFTSNGSDLTYKSKLVLQPGAIIQETEFIENTNRALVKNFGYLTMEGISIAGDILSKIQLPFPIHFDIELTKDMTVNLTASRNEIILDEKWYHLIESISHVLAKRLVERLDSNEKIIMLVEALKGVAESERIINNIREQLEIKVIDEARKLFN
ncbi:ATP-binding protein [Paenibacillus contaminans]|nr:ATP-binding protein [Paenibacillus contaminans]